MIENTESSDVSAESNTPIESTNDSQVKDPSQFPPADKISEVMKRKFQLKVDGEELEKEFDLNDVESLKREFQLSHVAKKRMAEAKEMKRQAYEMMQQMQNFKSNPLEMFESMGEEGRLLAEKYIYEKNARRATLT